MEKTVIYCDLCDKESGTAFSFAVDSEMDPAGSRDTIHKRVDLCPGCCAKQLELFILGLSWAARNEFAHSILKDKKQYLSALTKHERINGPNDLSPLATLIKACMPPPEATHTAR